MIRGPRSVSVNGEENSSWTPLISLRSGSRCPWNTHFAIPTSSGATPSRAPPIPSRVGMVDGGARLRSHVRSARATRAHALGAEASSHHHLLRFAHERRCYSRQEQFITQTRAAGLLAPREKIGRLGIRSAGTRGARGVHGNFSSSVVRAGIDARESRLCRCRREPKANGALVRSAKSASPVARTKREASSRASAE